MKYAWRYQVGNPILEIFPDLMSVASLTPLYEMIFIDLDESPCLGGMGCVVEAEFKGRRVWKKENGERLVITEGLQSLDHLILLAPDHIQPALGKVGLLGIFKQ